MRFNDEKPREIKVKIARHCVFSFQIHSRRDQETFRKEEAAQSKKTLENDGEKSSTESYEKYEMMKRENNQHIKRALN